MDIDRLNLNLFTIDIYFSLSSCRCIYIGLPDNSFKPITNTAWVRVRFCKLQKRGTRLAADKVYQLLADSRWFSPGTPASSITKTGHHDIAEILLKVVLSTKIKLNQINCYSMFFSLWKHLF
jgi:hypothetical protein